LCSNPYPPPPTSRDPERVTHSPCRSHRVKARRDFGAHQGCQRLAQSSPGRWIVLGSGILSRGAQEQRGRGESCKNPPRLRRAPLRLPHQPRLLPPNLLRLPLRRRRAPISSRQKPRPNPTVQAILLSGRTPLQRFSTSRGTKVTGRRNLALTCVRRRQRRRTSAPQRLSEKRPPPGA
jgi:hypothetical protein